MSINLIDCRPIIMLFAGGTVAMCCRGFKSGADEFLEKPVDDAAQLEMKSSPR